MFEGMKGAMQQFQAMQRMMQNEDFRNFISHPKVQELFRDPEFKQVAQSRDFSKIMLHPKFAALMRDPEVGQLMAKLNPKDFLQQ
jgi:hypothetical protein